LGGGDAGVNLAHSGKSAYRGDVGLGSKRRRTDREKKFRTNAVLGEGGSFLYLTIPGNLGYGKNT